jgi:nucleoid-associated protein EbfC
MNIQAMMAQAKKIQGEIERGTKEIEQTIYKYENDNILIETSGKNEVKRIEIKNDDILEDKELLADILTVGINNTLEQVKKDKNSKLGKYTNGLGGLF